MSVQAPLPVLPARAVQVGDVAGLVVDETGGQVYVRGEVWSVPTLVDREESLWVLSLDPPIL